MFYINSLICNFLMCIQSFLINTNQIKIWYENFRNFCIKYKNFFFLLLKSFQNFFLYSVNSDITKFYRPILLSIYIRFFFWYIQIYVFHKILRAPCLKIHKINANLESKIRNWQKQEKLLLANAANEKRLFRIEQKIWN